MRLVQRGAQVEDRNLRTPIHTCEAFFDATEPIAGEVVEREIEPSVLIRDIQETDHTENHLLSAMSSTARSFFIHSNHGLLNSPFSLAMASALGETDNTFLLGQREDGAVELFPQLIATSLLRVSALLLDVGNTLRRNDEIFDGQAGVSLLGHHPRLAKREPSKGIGCIPGCSTDRSLVR
jgi:hypothetical protein